MNALYAALPVYFDDAFAAFDIDDSHRAALVWLIPIGSAETTFIRESGWQKFESQLIAGNPDLLDLSRVEIF